VTALRRIRPTRRGTGVAFAVAFAGAIAALGGTRSLDAVAVPAAVALVVGAAQLARADRPRVRRTDPEPGAPGERRVVTVSVDSAVPCTVVEPVGEKLAVVDTPGGRGEGADCPGGETEVIEAVGHGGTFEYAVELGRRGEHRLGPARCRLVDSLGLFRATVPTEGGTTALVHPEIRAIDPTALPATGREPYGDDRSTFDRLREYTPGDSLRDIHWRASAKRPDEGFLIAEYSGHSGSARITLVGESGRDGADAMASAVASLAVHLVAAGETVTVVVPDGERSARPGETGGVLRVLALTDGGECTAAERARADVRVRAEGGAATVTASDRSVGFDALSTSPSRKRGEVPG
jgi:uncharacterized protein (DUF58 family)